MPASTRAQMAQRIVEKEASASKRAAGLTFYAGINQHKKKKLTRIDGLLRLALIPDDTRSLTARFCGDPLPGRSALDRRPQSTGDRK